MDRCLREQENTDETTNGYGRTRKEVPRDKRLVVTSFHAREGVLCPPLQNSRRRRKQGPALRLQLALDVWGREDGGAWPGVASGCEKRFLLGFNETGEPREEAPSVHARAGPKS